jgi:hypothetical protein
VNPFHGMKTVTRDYYKPYFVFPSNNLLLGFCVPRDKAKNNIAIKSISAAKQIHTQMLPTHFQTSRSIQVTNFYQHTRHTPYPRLWLLVTVSNILLLWLNQYMKEIIWNNQCGLFRFYPTNVHLYFLLFNLLTPDRQKNQEFIEPTHALQLFFIISYSPTYVSASHLPSSGGQSTLTQTIHLS